MRVKGCEMPGRGCTPQLLSKADFELCLSILVCWAQQACSPAPREYELPSPGCPFLWVCVTSSSHGPQHRWLFLTLKRLFSLRHSCSRDSRVPCPWNDPEILEEAERGAAAHGLHPRSLSRGPYGPFSQSPRDKAQMCLKSEVLHGLCPGGDSGEMPPCAVGLREIVWFGSVTSRTEKGGLR